MSLEIQISSSLLLTSANKRQTFFTSVLFRVLFGVIFFPKSCLKVLGAAYTRVRLIHESLRYMQTTGIYGHAGVAIPLTGTVNLHSFESSMKWLFPDFSFSFRVNKISDYGKRAEPAKPTLCKNLFINPDFKAIEHFEVNTYHTSAKVQSIS